MDTRAKIAAKLGAVLLLALCAVPLSATKTIVAQNTVRGNVRAVMLTVDGSGITSCRAYYVVKDAGGAVIKESSVDVSLNNGQKNAILAIVDSAVISAIDSVEGL